MKVMILCLSVIVWLLSYATAAFGSNGPGFIDARVQRSSGAHPENLFTLSELKDSYEIVNLPTDLPIAIEIRNESQVLSQYVVMMEQESRVVVQVHDGILKVVGPKDPLINEKSP